MPFARDLIASLPLTAAEYMARCNAHYYATRDPFGAQGDFTTAPEISQIFGELIGAWVADAWAAMGRPRATLCEPGPGRATLMKDALRATRQLQGFHDTVDIRLIETSPALRYIQQRTLHNAHPRIAWHETLDGLPPLPLLLIANEFFDALPLEQYVTSPSLPLPLKGEGSGSLCRGRGYAIFTETQRMVHYDGEKLTWRPEGEVTREASPASVEMMKRIATHIREHGGAALVIDYGYDGGAQGDTLQAVRKHRYADPLDGPGEADLTAHVDFAALAHAARSCGAYAHGPVEQGTFLRRLGAELRATALCKTATPQQQDAILSGLERIVSPRQMGRLFKAMAVTAVTDAPAGF